MVGQPMAVLMYYYDISKASSPNTPYDASDANNAGGELIAGAAHIARGAAKQMLNSTLAWEPNIRTITSEL